MSASASPFSTSEWDRALLEVDDEAPLLQSAGHARLQADEGWDPVGVVLGSGTRALVLVSGPPGLRHGYVPRGPMPATHSAICELAEWARQAGLVRLRCQPELPIAETAGLLASGFRLGPTVTPGLGRPYARYLYPEHTQLVPLGDPADMLRGCKPKHRYNIRLAERRGVHVELSDDVEELHRQQLATAHRQGIKPPRPDVYRRRLEELAWCHVYVARVGTEPVGAIMVARFGRRAYYLFGGTNGHHRELMPAYALQWRAMVDAAAAGCRHYDLFGVPPTGDPTHPWHGLWRFKTGFGGRLVHTAGALDMTFKGWRARLIVDAGYGSLADPLRRWFLAHQLTDGRSW